MSFADGHLYTNYHSLQWNAYLEEPSLKLLIMKIFVKNNKYASNLYFKLSYWLKTRPTPLKGSGQQFIYLFDAVLSSTPKCPLKDKNK